MIIDIGKLRKALQEERIGAFIAGGFGGAAVEALDIEYMPVEELVDLAKRYGLVLEDFVVPEYDFDNNQID